MSKSIKILQISDLHLFKDKSLLMCGVNTFKTFTAVMKLIREDLKTNSPELILFTGDFTQDGSKASYETFAKEIADLPRPVGWIPGNHDDLKIMKEIEKKYEITTIDEFHKNNWLILTLDSHVPGLVEGELSNDQLLFLINTLQENKNKNIIIFIHHHILPVGCHWLDALNLQNAEGFFQIIDPFPNVRVIATSHVHQDVVKTRNNVDYLCSPATCFQFKKNSPDFALDDAMPGYRWIYLNPDGSYSTEVKRVPFRKKFIPSKETKGY